MSWSENTRRHLDDEQGGITVMVALIAPLLALFLALVVVGAQWFEHKRHLQTQADAAALAAASDYSFPCGAAAVSAMNATIGRYGGGTYNPQIEGNQANVHVLLNSQTYFGQSATDDTPVGDPCATNVIDVKATETGVTNLMSIAGLAPTINAHARVELFRVKTLSGLRPIGVPDPTPSSARAYFVDEASAACGTAAGCDVIKSIPLNRNGTDAAGNPMWDNGSALTSVTVGSRSKIGVRVALGGGSSTTCGSPLVDCYDAGSSKGLVFIQGWTADGTVGSTSPPLARSVTLSGTTCGDPYFSRATGSCTIGVRAVVDFGTGAGNPVTDNNVKAKLSAGVGGQSYAMTYANGAWTTGEVIPVAAGSGPIAVSLDWEKQAGKIGSDNCKSGNGNKCMDTIDDVQRTFAGGDDRSGPLQRVQVFSNGTQLPDSVRRCDATNTNCTINNVMVQIAVLGSLTTAKTASEAPINLRIGNQNQTQALDCDPNISTLNDELAQGCGPSYAINTGTACPNKSSLWNAAQPWTCMALSTGTKNNQIAAGLNERILGDDKANRCTHPNRFRADFGHLDPADPRIVQLAISPYGSFSGTGNDTTVPITNFATFYVTGWMGSNGQGYNNPCETNDIPADANLRDDVPSSDSFVLGHFIAYKAPDGTPSDSRCDPSSITPCVSVLTR